jgi:hypothetical protein
MSHRSVKSPKLTKDKSRNIPKFSKENSERAFPMLSIPVLKRIERKSETPMTKNSRKKKVRFTMWLVEDLGKPLHFTLKS